jgi:hypothetical protein
MKLRRTLALMLGLLGAFSLAQAQSGRQGNSDSNKVELKASLEPTTDGSLAFGRAKYEHKGGEFDGDDDDGDDDKLGGSAESKLEVKVENLYSVPSIAIRLSGQLIGTAALQYGNGRFKLNSERGDTVPVVEPGALVEVLEESTEEVLLTGVFGDNDHSPEYCPRNNADVNQDGQFTFADIDEVSLAALGAIQSIYDVDLDNNGVVDVMDVDSVLNAGGAFFRHHFELGNHREWHAKATLHPVSKDGTAGGKAFYREHDGDKRRLRVKLHGLPLGTLVEVVVDGVTMGTVGISGPETFVKWDTKDGHFVPAVQNDTPIEVVDASTQEVLLAGTFDLKPNHHTDQYLNLFDSDIDGDGKVDAADVLLVWQGVLGQDLNGLNADVNEDGVVDQQDVEAVELAAIVFGFDRCHDLDSDGVMSATDIQLVVNKALDLPTPPCDADVDVNGSVDAVDVQRVIGRSLGL